MEFLKRSAKAEDQQPLLIGNNCVTCKQSVGSAKYSFNMKKAKQTNIQYQKLIESPKKNEKEESNVKESVTYKPSSGLSKYLHINKTNNPYKRMDETKRETK